MGNQGLWSCRPARPRHGAGHWETLPHRCPRGQLLRPVRGGRRLIITTIDELRTRAPTFYGKSFAFDLETSGLDPIRDRILGVSLCFEDGQNYYIVLEHTNDDQPWKLTAEGQRRINAELAEIAKIPIEDHDHDAVYIPTLDELHEPAYYNYGRDGCWERNTTTYITVDQIRPALNWIFDQQDVWMVAHNAKFDIRFLRRGGMDIRGKLHDTMLAGKMIDENYETYGLKDMALRDLGVVMQHYQNLTHYHGFDRDEFLAVPLDEAADYALADTLATWGLFEQQQPLLEREEVALPFYETWMPLLRVLADMEDRGIALDIDAIRAFREECIAEAATLERSVWLAGIDMVLSWAPDIPPAYQKIARRIDPDFVDTGQATWTVNGIELPLLRAENKRSLPRLPDFNVGSPKQLGDLLYDHLSLAPPRGMRLTKGKTNGGRSVDRDTLEVMKIHYGDNAPEALDLLLQWRKLNKLVTAFLDPMIEKADPTDNYCLRTNFNQHIADTGRLSSSGPNLQQVPSRGKYGPTIRSFFRARPGYKLIVADFSNQELRLIGHFARDPNYIQAFADGWDLHALTASKQFDVPYEELLQRIEDDDPDAKRMRMMGKLTNLSALYGIGKAKFKVRLYVDGEVDVSLDESQRLLDGLAEGYVATTEWKERVVVWSKKLGYAKCLAGRKRRLPGLYAGDKYEVMRAERQAVNFVIQGSAADVTADALIEADRLLKPIGAHLLLAVHDEIVLEAPEDRAEEAAEILRYAMSDYINQRYQLVIPMAADPVICNTWKEGK